MKWNVKLIYPSGGHLVTDSDNKVLRFDSELAAKNMAENLNSKVKNKPEQIHIVVPETIYS